MHEVRLMVRVDDALGLPVDDLTVNDFTVKEDGVPVEIVSFRKLGTTGELSAERAVEPSTAADDVAVDTDEDQRPEDNLVVLLFDIREIYPRFVRAVDKTADWIRENPEMVRERTWLAAILDGSVGVVGAATSDPEVLAETVDAIRKRKLQDRVWRFVESPADNSWVRMARAYNAAEVGRAAPGSDPRADQRDRLLMLQDCNGRRYWMLDQVEKLQQLVESLAPISGRKTVIWMHGSNQRSYPETCENYFTLQVARAIQDLGSVAASAGVVVHASSLGGLTLKYGGPSVGSELISEYLMDSAPVAPYYEHLLSLGGLARNMAIHTGGQRVVLNDPSWVFHRAFEDPVYELVVLVPHGRDGREHQVKVDLKGHPLALLQYQRSYLALSKRQLFMNQLERSSLLPGSYGAIPVHMRWQGQRDGDHNQVQLTVAAPVERVGAVERDGRLIAEVEPWIAVHRPDGELVEVRQLDASSLSLPADTVLKPTDAFTASTTLDLPMGEFMITGAFFDRLNETSGVTSANLDLNPEDDR